ncbi:hypothetical protein Pcinc_044449 [Petrolisthes cinctipes]|uniref:Uncharacterized protein n=1 Tax=Petrolisthes cinctipes TaxID=88211 RepID=A0AAE1BEA1_PETCI|nr:hypothetical protein Pcinc_044449 [Petrolisthes cinctipes]
MTVWRERANSDKKQSDHQKEKKTSQQKQCAIGEGEAGGKEAACCITSTSSTLHCLNAAYCGLLIKRL